VLVTGQFVGITTLTVGTVGPMEHRSLGTLEVSIAGLGCNNFGMRVDHDTSLAIVHRALDCGITMFDTADVYGGGLSETWLGEAVAGARNNVVIATKFGWPDTRGLGLTSSDAVTSVENSLRRLATDSIDLLYVHQPDLGEPIEATLEKLDALVCAGKVREVGCSNITAEHLLAADDSASTLGVRPFACVEEQYNLLWRHPERELLPACSELGTKFVPFFPLANGLLTGKYKFDELPSPETRLGWVLQRGVTGQAVDVEATDPRGAIEAAMNWHPHDKERVDLDVVVALQDLADSSGRTMVELALGWLAAHPQIPSVIAGATSPDQVSANAAATECRLTPAEIDALDALTARMGDEG
jgi:aryl-alcohol dehydrogenase-like predicted oxidoreductase